MKSIALLLLVSAVAFGQRAGSIHSPSGYHTNSFGSITGFGNVVYPGTGHPPAIHGSSNILRRPVGPGIGPGTGNGRFRGGSAIVYVPYGVGGSYYEPGEAAAGGYYPQQQQQQAPQVVINQNFISETARPMVREYTSDPNGAIRLYQPEPAAQAPEENPTYLIAFKDHTIYAALAYWVEDGTLHYVTNQNTHNQVSLDLVDRELSDRLNRERSVDFRLPPRR